MKEEKTRKFEIMRIDDVDDVIDVFISISLFLSV
jgi:hypothetical protein